MVESITFPNAGVTYHHIRAVIDTPSAPTAFRLVKPVTFCFERILAAKGRYIANEQLIKTKPPAIYFTYEERIFTKTEPYRHEFS
jgi:hypothetical protein